MFLGFSIVGGCRSWLTKCPTHLAPGNLKVLGGNPEVRHPEVAARVGYRPVTGIRMTMKVKVREGVKGKSLKAL